MGRAGGWGGAGIVLKSMEMFEKHIKYLVGGENQKDVYIYSQVDNTAICERMKKRDWRERESVCVCVCVNE